MKDKEKKIEDLKELLKHINLEKLNAKDFLSLHRTLLDIIDDSDKIIKEKLSIILDAAQKDVDVLNSKDTELEQLITDNEKIFQNKYDDLKNYIENKISSLTTELEKTQKQQSTVYVPVKGKDYFDGKNGYTPVKGVDYFDGEKGEQGEKGMPGLDGVEISAEEIKQKLESLPPDLRLDKNFIRGYEQFTTQMQLDYAISKLRNQVSFIINKLENTSSGGGSIGGSIQANQIGYGSALNTLTSDANATRNPITNDTLIGKIGIGTYDFSLQIGDPNGIGFDHIGIGITDPLSSATSGIFAVPGTVIGLPGDTAFLINSTDSAGVNSSSSVFSPNFISIETDDGGSPLETAKLNLGLSTSPVPNSTGFKLRYDQGTTGSLDVAFIGDPNGVGWSDDVNNLNYYLPLTPPTVGQVLGTTAGLPTGGQLEWISPTGITLQTNGTPNGSQTLLNLQAGTNITLTDNGSGKVTIDASGTGSPHSPDKGVQYNHAGTFYADPLFTRDFLSGDTDILTTSVSSGYTTGLVMDASVTPDRLSLLHFDSTTNSGASTNYFGSTAGVQSITSLARDYSNGVNNLDAFSGQVVDSATPANSIYSIYLQDSGALNFNSQLALTTTNVQLSYDYDYTNSYANNLKIDTNALTYYSSQITNVQHLYFKADTNAGIYGLGDLDNVQNGTGVAIEDSLKQAFLGDISFSQKGMGAYINNSNGTGGIGSFGGTGNHQAAFINDTTLESYVGDYLNLKKGMQLYINNSTDDLVLGSFAVGNKTNIIIDNAFQTIMGRTVNTTTELFHVSAGSGKKVTYGYLAGNAITTATNTSLFGESAGTSITTAIDSTAMGYFALSSNVGGDSNSAFGVSALTALNNTVTTDALGNSAFGKLAGAEATNANYSTFIGYHAGHNATTQSNSIFIGANSQSVTAPGQGDGSIALGVESAIRFNGGMFIGSENYPIDYIYAGTGQINGGTKRNLLISASQMIGTNKQGGDLNLAIGLGTGSAAPGLFHIISAVPGTSGSSSNPILNMMTVQQDVAWIGDPNQGAYLNIESIGGIRRAIQAGDLITGADPFQLNFITQTYRIGTSTGGNGTNMIVADSSQLITMNSATGTGFYADMVGGNYHMGADGFGNGTYWAITDSTKDFVIQSGNTTTIRDTSANLGLSADFTNKIFQLGAIGYGNSTEIKVDDVNQLVTISNVPTYANDAAATGAGLTTGQLYKTTTLGITALNIVP